MNDPIEQSTDADTMSAETSISDQSDAASSETQQNDTQNEAGEETASGSTEAQAETGSSTNPDTTSQNTNAGAGNAQQATAQPVKTAEQWQAELEGLKRDNATWRAKHNQSSNSLHQMRQQYNGVDPEAVRKWNEAQKAAADQKLPVWDKRNPGNQGFRSTLTQFKSYQQAMAKADTPEKKALLQETMGSLFSQDQAQQLREWDDFRAKFHEDFAMDPRGTLSEIIKDELRSELQNERMTQEADHEVNSWMTDPANKQIVSQYGPQMLDALTRGNQWSFVRQMAIDRAKLDALQSRVGTADKAAAQGRAVTDLAKQKAVHKRDGAVRPQKDPVAEADRIAKEKGIDFNHPEYFNILDRITKTQSL